MIERRRSVCKKWHIGLDREKENDMFEAVYYIVASIDGDYANLQKADGTDEELKLVARALLPAEITEGTQLKYEMLQYEIVR